MNIPLAQAIKLPGPDDSQMPIPYPTQFRDFKFASSDLGKVITNFIPFVFAFAGIGLLLMILGAGFTLLTSAGDAKKLESGKQRLTYAIVGFIVIFVAYWLVQIAGFVFGIPEIGQIFQ
ncbi:MAG: hypothetical protein ACOY0S_03160 [Patescibacteria group bacterium]